MPTVSPLEPPTDRAPSQRPTQETTAPPLEVAAISGTAYPRWPKAFENIALRRQGWLDACPVCGQAGDPVGLVTLRALLRRALKGTPEGEGFRYCRTLRCPVVWYRGDPPFVADAAAARVPVNVKMTETARPLCYCLRVDEATVVREVVERGCCSTLEDVQRATRANTGKACHVTNPSGSCCERDVLGALAKGLASVGRQAQMAAFQPLEGCCVRPANDGNAESLPAR